MTTNKASANSDESDDLRAEYDLDYAQSRPNRFAPRMSGTTVAVVLEPDVAAVFGTSEAVNRFLRSVISALPADRIQNATTKRSASSLRSRTPECREGKTVGCLTCNSVSGSVQPGRESEMKADADESDGTMTMPVTEDAREMWLRPGESRACTPATTTGSFISETPTGRDRLPRARDGTGHPRMAGRRRGVLPRRQSEVRRVPGYGRDRQPHEGRRAGVDAREGPGGSAAVKRSSYTGAQSNRWKRTRSRHGTARWRHAPDQAELDAIVTSIVKTVDPDRIILFGSAARGTMNDESDLDILVVKDRCRPRGTTTKILDAAPWGRWPLHAEKAPRARPHS